MPQGFPNDVNDNDVANNDVDDNDADDNDVDDNDSVEMHLLKNEWRPPATTLVPRDSISHSLAAHRWPWLEDEDHLKETPFVSPSPSILDSILWRDEWHHIGWCHHQQNHGCGPSVINIYIVNINNHITRIEIFQQFYMTGFVGQKFSTVNTCKWPMIKRRKFQ